MTAIKCIPILFILSGCATVGLKPPPVVLVQEDYIFTLKAGTPISLYLDGIQKDMVFPYDMKIVHPSTIIKYEEAVGAKNRKNIKRNISSKQRNGIIGGVVTLLSALVIIWKRSDLKGMFKKITITRG